MFCGLLLTLWALGFALFIRPQVDFISVATPSLYTWNVNSLSVSPVHAKTQEKTQEERKRIVSFVVLFKEHTGSSHLTELANKHPSILIAGYEPLSDELWPTPHQLSNNKVTWTRLAFSPPLDGTEAEYEEWIAKLKALMPLPEHERHSWLVSKVTKHRILSGQIKAVGFKVLPRHIGFVAGSYENNTALFQNFSMLIQELDSRLVVLSRSNTLKWSLSKYRRHAVGLSQFTNDSAVVRCLAEDKRLLSATYVRSEELEKWLHRAEYHRRQLWRATRGLSIGVSRLDLKYESLLHRREETMQRLFSFLEVEELDKLPPATELQYTKSTPDDLCRALINFEELCIHFRNTSYAKFFRTATAARKGSNECVCEKQPLDCTLKVMAQAKQRASPIMDS